MVTTNKLTTRAASVLRLGVILSIAHVTSSSLRSDDCVVLCCRRNRQIHVFQSPLYRFSAAYAGRASSAVDPWKTHTFPHFQYECSPSVLLISVCRIHPFRMLMKPNHGCVMCSYIQKGEEKCQGPSSGRTFHCILSAHFVQSVNCTFSAIVGKDDLWFLVTFGRDHIVVMSS
jgi:hypothetical protein